MDTDKIKRLNAALYMKMWGAPNAPHRELSVLTTLNGKKHSTLLIDTFSKAIKEADKLNLSKYEVRGGENVDRINVWPGEHYRLLPGLVKAINATKVIEIGTHNGLACLAMLDVLPKDSSLVTYDIMPWQKFKGTNLKEEDFKDGRLVMHNADVSNPHVMDQHAKVFQEADMIFVDAPGRAEFLKQMKRIGVKEKCLVIIDDIRLWEHQKLWQRIALPKLDVSSLSHFSGTGLVEWSSKEKLFY